jgi:Vacuolar protein sorting-associated protein 62
LHPETKIQTAPLVWLDIGEQYFPSDMYEQITNTHPEINLTSIENPPTPLTLHNLDVLNDYGNDGMNVYLTSNIDVTEGPKWLDGVVPDSTGKTKNAISCAVIINDHGSGNVDVFYMYFYAYNLGNTVLFHELGDHVGDWEHNMIRFKDSEPQAIWFSQHANGQAFTYKALEKEGLRPITYSAVGSHANYAVAGAHDHAIPDLNLPVGFLLDFTSQGQLWDPTLSTYFYNYQPETASFESINESPLGAMHFKGRWGDQRYPDSDPRQPPPFFGFRKFVGGPTGPWDKQLNRTNVCPETGIPCIIRDTLGP